MVPLLVPNLRPSIGSPFYKNITRHTRLPFGKWGDSLQVLRSLSMFLCQSYLRPAAVVYENFAAKEHHTSQPSIELYFNANNS